ncbi:DBH-like monooxygenase protein 1 homolog [Anneissia japonica]|uniref:DBH-like monooxygenase protein 1 homolog n=1 Tax=Anneissia japonica TaxID=1529436 RepID=UPI00142599C4|nr:DBH-like monooxygenase protein 1 homolog [Anneissia japonica]
MITNMSKPNEIFLSTVILSVLFSIAIKAQNTVNEKHETVLNEDYEVLLKWRVDGDVIFFEMSAQTQGYVAIGFSPNGGMPGSDIVAGWVKDGKAFISDFYATEFAKPIMDFSNDYELLYGSEEGGRTTVGFKRKLQTCDTSDYKITGDTARIIWAVNDRDPATLDDLSYHGSSRGVRSLVLLDATAKLHELPKDADSFELLLPNVAVPSDDTTYWCSTFAVPKFDKPVHVFRFDTIVQEGHEALVHHTLLYGCRGNVSSVLGYSSTCERDNMPPDLEKCSRILYAWAIGAGSFEFPEHVGLPLGGESDPTFFFVEMHYDNPGRRADFVDSSGFKVHYTSTPRQYEADIWMVGEAFRPTGQMIPPKESDFKTMGFCLGDCTKVSMSEDIKVFAAFLHGHLTVRKISMQHYRDGKLIDDIRDDNYDFNLQETRLLTEERIFKPGDDYVVTCSYNTMDRENITVGGESTTNEMCVSFVYYYPRQSRLGYCLSSPSEASVINMLGLDEGQNNLLNQIKQMNSKEMKDGLKKVMKKGKRYNFCINPVTTRMHEGIEFEVDFPPWYKEDQRIITQDACVLASINSGSKMMRAGYWNTIPVFAIFMCLYAMFTV